MHLLLQVLSLTMDGLTGAVQERMIAESKTKSGHMMLNMNLFSIGYLAIGELWGSPVEGSYCNSLQGVYRAPKCLRF